MLTLGFVPPSGTGEVFLAFTEATLGLGIVALLISYLPSIYGAFGRREQLVGQLEVRAGIPPSPAELLTRYQRIGWLRRDRQRALPEVGAVVRRRRGEPHVAARPRVLPLAAARSAAGSRRPAACSTPLRSWTPPSTGPAAPATAVMIRTGFLALRRIADYFGIDYPTDVGPDTPISVTRRECDLALRRAGRGRRAAEGRPRPGLAGLRRLAGQLRHGAAWRWPALVMAPPAKWSSDRAAPTG